MRSTNLLLLLLLLLYWTTLSTAPSTYVHICTLFVVRMLFLSIIMRPSSLGGGRILRRTLSVCLSVCPSVCPSVPFIAIATSVTCFRQPCGRAVSFVWFTCQDRILFGDLSRTSLFQLHIICYPALGPQGCY